MTESEVDSVAQIENVGDTNINIECQSTSSRNEEQSIICKILSNAILHSLEVLLSAVLTPYFIYQWLSRHDHIMILLKVITEVMLELMMWTIFAFVSILTAATVLFDDWYKEQEKPKAEQRNENSQTDVIGEGKSLQIKSVDFGNIDSYTRNCFTQFR